MRCPRPRAISKRLREICDKHDILLVFDEVITGFGRLGYAFAAERYGVVPDMITFAKAVNSGTVPMGGVICRKHIYDAFMSGPDNVVELFHGYTYSGHPLACAATIATLDIYQRENLFERTRAVEERWADCDDVAQGPAQRGRYPHARPRRRRRSRAETSMARASAAMRRSRRASMITG